MAGLNAVRQLKGGGPLQPPRNTMMGSLAHYLTATEPGHFQPINAMWGLVEPASAPGGASAGRGPKESKYARFMRYRDRAMDEFEAWAMAEGLELHSAELVESLARDQAAAANGKRLLANQG
jgi:methylenetetrahydrofolate--tRNA-(uracil-5-)-methyltransferase